MANTIIISWALTLLASGIIVLIFAQMSKGSAPNRKMWTWIGIGGLIVGFVAYAGIIPQLDFLNNPLTGGAGKTKVVGDTTIIYSSAPTTPRAPSSNICPYDGITVTLSAMNKYTAASAGGTHRYRINGNPALTVADGGTFSATPGDSVEVLFANGSSGSNYFGERKTLELPCSATTTMSTDLVQNGTLTVEVFNEELNLINTAGENETLGVGDVVTLTANLKGTYQRGYPYGGVIVVEFNNSDYDDIIADFGGSTTTIPNFFTVSNTANVARAYTVPSILSNQILNGKITLDVDATNNPGDANDTVVRLYPNNYFINEDTSGSFDGPAVGDEDNAQVLPIHTTSFTLSVD